MIPFYYAVVFILLGMLFSYLQCVRYLKGLRGILSPVPDHYPILVSIFFGGPVLLLTYLFSDIRDEDAMYKRRYLICGIIFTILQITLVALLIYFKVLTFEVTQQDKSI